MSKVLTILFLALVAGCSITQRVSPVAGIEVGKVCIIENPAVRAGFLNEYKGALEQKGYTPAVLAAGSVNTECEVSSTYTARWSWDLALYLAYAEIKVFHNGAVVGEALYDATRGSGRLDKFIDTNAKIRELVDQLFP